MVIYNLCTNLIKLYHAFTFDDDDVQGYSGQSDASANYEADQISVSRLQSYTTCFKIMTRPVCFT